MRQDDTEISVKPISEVSTGTIKRKAPQIPNWQPTCLRLPLFVGAVTLTLLHSAMCAVLIVLKYTESTRFTFKGSNAGAFFFWQFIPIILAVIPGLIWEVIYIQVCRLQPYRDLASPQGSTLVDSLSQTYLTSFAWFVPYHALKHPERHTGLAMISVAYLLSYGVLPAVTIAMIEIRWDDPVTEGTARPLIYLIVLGLLVSMSTVAFATAAFVILRRQKSGLYSNPASLAGVGSLVAESNLLQRFQSLRSFETQEGIDKALGDLQLTLGHTGASYQISLLDPSQTIPELPEKKWRRDSNEAHPWWLRGSTYTGLFILMLIPIGVLYGVLFQQAHAALLNEDPLQINGKAFAVKICTAILSLVNAAIYANLHLNVAILHPYHMLADCVQKKLQGSSSALRADFTGSAIFNFLRPEQSLDIWLVAVCALLTQLAVIIRPAGLQNLASIAALGWKNSSNPYLSSSFDDINIPAGVPPLRIILYVFEAIYWTVQFFAFLLVMMSKRKPFLPRKPYTLSSQILYLCHGTELLDDLKSMSTLSKQARDTCLKQNGHKYALGWMEDGTKTCSYVSIDRLENITRRFKYPKPDHNDVAREYLDRETFERLHPGDDEGKTRRDAGWPDNAK
ncbi:hypothetical protein H2200_008975 [Cladophialophora chaetospira]|uniref:Uncharacterized protein n=1 Tax=Cladophialophora chaetospira TaxID=386627 RepID=A0AA38X502_9EURO|nr:hypothetical protein H2200_008975 [Cladophialophora chaetospira]